MVYSSMNKVVGTVVGIAILVCMAYVVWRYKWIIICTVVGISIVLHVGNTIYHRCTGRDMAIYAHIMKEDK